MNSLIVMGLAALAWVGFIVIREHWRATAYRIDQAIDRALYEALSDEEML